MYIVEQCLGFHVALCNESFLIYILYIYEAVTFSWWASAMLHRR
jgi:hypothetical protein